MNEIIAGSRKMSPARITALTYARPCPVTTAPLPVSVTVEVKVRAQFGAIRLPVNEWKKARRFEERFWLYIVTMGG